MQKFLALPQTYCIRSSVHGSSNVDRWGLQGGYTAGRRLGITEPKDHQRSCYFHGTPFSLRIKKTENGGRWSEMEQPFPSFRSPWPRATRTPYTIIPRISNRSVSQHSAAEIVILGPTPSVSSGNLLEIRNPRPHSRPAESKSAFLIRCQADLNMHSCLRSLSPNFFSSPFFPRLDSPFHSLPSTFPFLGTLENAHA